MLDGFSTRTIRTRETEIFVRTAGVGQPVLLVHGFPQTGMCWHRIAPTLAERFSVVVPDIRGYGASGKPPSVHDHASYSKRAMAVDLVEVMAELGHDRFAVVGHDRGARVSYRLALDHPDRVSGLCSLDVIPTVETWEKLDLAGMVDAFHWPFLARPAPMPETLVAADPDYFYGYLMQSWAAPDFLFDAHAMQAYLKAMRDPEVIRATCEDYRAGAAIDVVHDKQDREEGRKVACPILFLFGALNGFGHPDADVDPLETWRRWCDSEVSGGPIPTGHFLPEEAPGMVLEQLLPFLMDVL